MQDPKPRTLTELRADSKFANEIQTYGRPDRIACAWSRGSVMPSLLWIEGELVTILRHGRACPGHPRLSCCQTAKTWMPGTRPGMTSRCQCPNLLIPLCFTLRSALPA